MTLRDCQAAASQVKHLNGLRVHSLCQWIDGGNQRGRRSLAKGPEETAQDGPGFPTALPSVHTDPLPATLREILLFSKGCPG